MMSDVIIAWPQHLDYPLFRKFLSDYRRKFDKVIIVFTNMNTAVGDYRQFIIESMLGDKIIFLNNAPVSAEQDWRNVAVNTGLTRSDSEWVTFLEQDFFPKGRFWETLEENLPKNDIAYINIEGRVHPCFLSLRRTTLNETSKDFSANPPSHDHFGQIQKDLEVNTPPLRWFSVMPYLYYHMNALSQNMYMLQTGEEPNFRPDEFAEYCGKCLRSGIELHPDFKTLFEWYISK